MSEPVYYLRNQGKVTGPFTLQHMRMLRQRGHVGRFHEVSEDRQNWTVATDLFGDSAPVSSFTEGGGLDGQWYFTDAQGNARGPVSGSALQNLAASGKLSRSTLCLKHGTKTWVSLELALSGASGSDIQGMGAPGVIVEPGESPSEAAIAWRRIRLGLDLKLLSLALTAGAGLLYGIGVLILVQQRWIDDEPAVLVFLLLGILVGLAGQVMSAVGLGFCAAAPRTSGARGLGIAVFVLALVEHAFLFVLMLLAVTLSRSRFLVHPDTGVMGLLWFPTTVIAVVEVFLFHLYLRAVAIRLRASRLVRQIGVLAFLYGGCILFCCLWWALAVGFGLAAFRDRASAEAYGVLLLVFGAILGIVFLGWFVWFFVVVVLCRGVVDLQVKKQA